MTRARPLRAYKHWRGAGFSVRSAIYLAMKWGCPAWY